MARSGQDARRPPEATARAGSSGPTRQSQTSGLDTQLALRLVGLAVLGHMLRSRRFYERVAVGAIVLAALARIGQENRASTFARLAAWNKRQAQFLERQAERQAAHLQRQAERQGRRLVRKAKGPLAASGLPGQTRP
jgi:regulator of protease activity HflC (stomatin/prohibitin superfamily)